MPPERLIASRYVLHERLGSGAMGTVWRATDQILGRGVAIKEIHPSFGDTVADGVARERAIREARAAAALRHPHIVPVHDVIDGDEFPWIVMQLINGASLRQLVNSSGPLPPERVARIGLDLLDALEAAHSAGIVHRDVKPANVLLGEEGGIWLTDFGIAHMAGDETVTSIGMALGTPGYLAPEQARGIRPGPAADIFGLAATLYFAVEGVGPFEAETPVASLGAVVLSPPRPPTRAAALGPVLTTMLDKNPATRPDITRARAALGGTLSGESPAPGPGAGTRVTRAARRAMASLRGLATAAVRTRQISPVVVIAAVVALGAVAMSVRGGEPTAGDQPAASQPSGPDDQQSHGPGGVRPGGSDRPWPPPDRGRPGTGQLTPVATLDIPFPVRTGYAATIRESTLFLVGGAGAERQLIAFDLTGGTRRWQVSAPGGGTPPRIWAVREAIAVAAPDSGGAALYRATDGKQLWRRDRGVAVVSLLPGGLLVVGRRQDAVWGTAVVGPDGGERWRSPGTAAPQVFRATGGDFLVLERPDSRTARVRRAADGATVSTGPAAPLARFTPDRVVDGVFIDDAGGDLVGVDPIGGREMWRLPGARKRGVVLRCARQLVCLHDAAAGRLEAIDARTGTTRWTITSVAYHAGGYALLDPVHADTLPVDGDRSVLAGSGATAVVDVDDRGSVLYQGEGQSLLLDARHLLLLRPEGSGTAPESNRLVHFVHLRDGHVRPLDTINVNAPLCAANLAYLACPVAASSVMVWAVPPPPPPPPA